MYFVVLELVKYVYLSRFIRHLGFVFSKLASRYSNIMEIIQDEAERILRKLNTVELNVIAEFLKIDKEAVEEKSKAEVLREIQAVLDGIEEDYQRKGVLQSLPIPGAHRAAYEKVFKEGNVQPIELKAETESSTERQTKQVDMTMFKRDFKISGVIADGTPKALNYINLCSQINEGTQKGYKKAEIVAAIKKAISPGTGLRTYVDSQHEMTLDEILQFLRSFLREKSPTELFTDLNQLCQKQNEEPATFLLRALEIRQKVLIASEAEGVIKYEKDLVQRMFLHAVRTGLNDGSVRNHMIPFLDFDRSHPDDVLLREINIATSEEKERETKQRVNGDRSDRNKSVCVAAVETDGVNQILQPLVDAVADMKTQIEGLTRRVNSMPGSNNDNRQDKTNNSWKRRGCQDCIRTNRGKCNHCWKCGQEGHQSKSCQQQQPKGNGQRK